MSRIAKPLNPQAQSFADEQLYSQHEADSRENALFDIDGNRKPLDPLDPNQEELRKEWRGYYNDALAKAHKSADRSASIKPAPSQQASPAVGADDRPISQANQPCPNSHWIRVMLWPNVNPKKWPSYWPAMGPSTLYGGEKYTADLTDASREGELDGIGGFFYNHIPAGMCFFTTQEILSKAKADLKKRSAYKSPNGHGSSGSW